jgi:hypothetical protein
MKGVLIAMKKNLEKKAQVKVAAPRPAVLRFSPTAWAKLLFLRDAGNTEIGGFGISPAEDLLFVEDIALVTQTCTLVHVEFGDYAVADYFDRQVDAGRRPEQFARIWVHTHPGNSAEPSGTDELTFSRVFGRADWAVMFILARGGQSFARLRYNVGPGVDVKLPVDVDYARAFAASDQDGWQAEYTANVGVPESLPTGRLVASREFGAGPQNEDLIDDWWQGAWDDYADFDHYPQEAEHGFVQDF